MNETHDGWHAICLIHAHKLTTLRDRIFRNPVVYSVDYIIIVIILIIIVIILILILILIIIIVNANNDRLAVFLQ